MKLLDIFKKKIKTNTSPNTIVFTTKKVMLENQVITRVYHSSDNSLQFFDENSTNSNANVMLVGLQQILKKDPTVNIAINMPLGHCGVRKTIKDKWIIEPFQENEDD